jgi:hypothetical protein
MYVCVRMWIRFNWLRIVSYDGICEYATETLVISKQGIR